MKNKSLLSLLLPAIALALFALLSATGCNSVRIAAQPPGAGEITIYQGAWKSSVGENNAVEATTSPTTDARAALK
jgi:hypothetical protein